MVMKNDILVWKDFPITQEMFKELRAWREDLAEQLITFTPTSSDVAMNRVSFVQGAVNVLDSILDGSVFENVIEDTLDEDNSDRKQISSQDY